MSKKWLRQIGLSVSFLVIFALQAFLPRSFGGFEVDPFKWFFFQGLLFVVFCLLLYRLFTLPDDPTGKYSNGSPREDDSLQPDSLRNPDQLIGAVVHEIRTPLNKLRLSIKGESESEDSPRPGEILDELTGLVGDIEDVFRERNPSRDWISTVELTRRVAGFCEQSDRLQFIVGVDWLYLDADKILMTVTNLIQNSLEAYDSEQDGVDVRVESVGPEWCLTISDRAGGMAPEVSRVISSQKQSAASDSSGMGLGLLLARRIVENHNGRMIVESDPPVGTEITLTLPKPSNRAGDE